MRWFLAALTQLREREDQKIVRRSGGKSVLSEVFGPNPANQSSVTP